MRSIIRWILVVALVFVAVACTRTIDKTSLEDSIKTQLESSASVSGVSVTCPDNIKAEKGGTFTCTASAQGETVTLQVTQTDDQGHVTFKVAK
jgi:Domain of unknown function (DUF4333)